MIYLALGSIMLTVFIAVFPVVINYSVIVFKSGWGKVIKTLAVNADVIHPVLIKWWNIIMWAGLWYIHLQCVYYCSFL